MLFQAMQDKRSRRNGNIGLGCDSLSLVEEGTINKSCPIVEIIKKYTVYIFFYYFSVGKNNELLKHPKVMNY